MRVLIVLVPISVGSELLGTASFGIFHEVIHAGLLSDWAGETVTNILLSPFYAVAAVLITLQLSAHRGRPA